MRGSAWQALALAALLASAVYAQDGGDSKRSVAFTFDDLPASRIRSLEEVRGLTERLLGQIHRLGIPAIGFVNEGKLAVAGEEREWAALLEAWLDAGLELGNHTYSHLRLYDVPLTTVEADVLRGERVTRPLMATRGKRLRYFRHPTLNTGPDLRTKESFEGFLAEHGYTIAPVTIDSDEYLYALAYDRARVRGDRTMMSKLSRDYLRYMEDMLRFDERLSEVVFGRQAAQILLLHANMLNADHLHELAAMIAGRGYRFISLEKALADPAYRHKDTYVGARGPSWLERWALTDGIDPGTPPEIPAWVRLAGNRN